MSKKHDLDPAIRDLLEMTYGLYELGATDGYFRDAVSTAAHYQGDMIKRLILRTLYPDRYPADYLSELLEAREKTLRDSLDTAHEYEKRAIMYALAVKEQVNALARRLFDE